MPSGTPSICRHSTTKQGALFPVQPTWCCSTTPWSESSTLHRSELDLRQAVQSWLGLRVPVYHHRFPSTTSFQRPEDPTIIIITNSSSSTITGTGLARDRMLLILYCFRFDLSLDFHVRNWSRLAEHFLGPKAENSAETWFYETKLKILPDWRFLR